MQYINKEKEKYQEKYHYTKEELEKMQEE